MQAIISAYPSREETTKETSHPFDFSHDPCNQSCDATPDRTANSGANPCRDSFVSQSRGTPKSINQPCHASYTKHNSNKAITETSTATTLTTTSSSPSTVTDKKPKQRRVKHRSRRQRTTKKKGSRHNMSTEVLLPPNSPAAYCSSPLPLLNDYFFDHSLSGDKAGNEMDDIDSMTASTATDTAMEEIENVSGDLPSSPSLDNAANSTNDSLSFVSKAGATTKDCHSSAKPVEIVELPYEEASNETEKDEEHSSFLAFRIHYLIVHIAIMLADGLQGTHLYVLYEGYGYTVASLYCLGFLSGAATSPFIGPIVDYKLGRRTAAIIYCLLEIAINMAEQHSIFVGLVLSRIVGGITTNLLFTVFESWLVTEHRKRGFKEDKLEIILRDSVVASNLSAIASGCLAHILAEKCGNCGPFSGAVGCTFVALVLVATRWEENFGNTYVKEHYVVRDEKGRDELVPGIKSIRNHMSDALSTIVSDSKISRIGIIQGLSEGALQTFVFLWSPTLRHFALNMPHSTSSHIIGIASDGEPAYGLIFGAFMACGAIGGVCEPATRKRFVSLLQQQDDKVTCAAARVVAKQENDVSSQRQDSDSCSETSSLDNSSEDEKPVAVELLASISFLISAILLSTPIFVNPTGPNAFSASLVAFLFYEFFVGLYMPCEGVIRSIYMPNDSICSIMTMLRVIVNVSVALGVISTNYIPFTTAFAACSGSLMIAAVLQLSLVTEEEWGSLRSLLNFSFSGHDNIVDDYAAAEMDNQLPVVPIVRRLNYVNGDKFTNETLLDSSARTSYSAPNLPLDSDTPNILKPECSLERNSLQKQGLRKRITKPSNRWQETH